MFFFLELSCFFNDPTDVGNLISGSSAFSKSSLNTWCYAGPQLLRASAQRVPPLLSQDNWATNIHTRVCVCVSVCVSVCLCACLSPTTLLVLRPLSESWHCQTLPSFCFSSLQRFSLIGDHRFCTSRIAFFIFWLCRTTCGISVPPPGIEPVHLQCVQGLNHRTTREVPEQHFLITKKRTYDICINLPLPKKTYNPTNQMVLH